jgi:predicted RNase H-like nuclease (RuvC/YqgF family)
MVDYTHGTISAELEKELYRYSVGRGDAIKRVDVLAARVEELEAQLRKVERKAKSDLKAEKYYTNQYIKHLHRAEAERDRLRELLGRCLRTYNTPLYPDQTIAAEIRAAIGAAKDGGE